MSLSGYIIDLINDPLLPILVLIFLAVATVTGLVVAFVNSREGMRRRTAGLGRLSEPSSNTDRRSPNAAARVRSQKLLAYVTTHFKPSDGRQAAEARRQLTQAGFMSESAVGWYFASRALMAVAMAGLAFFGIPGSPIVLTDSTLLLAAGGAGVIGYILPSIYLGRRITANQDEHRSGFPDFMDLMVVCADAGLAMEAAIERVGRELMVSYPSLAGNLYMATLEMRAGKTLGEALEHLGDRLGIEEARSFATLLQQSEELGSSLTEALRVYSDDMRHKRLSRAEEKAYALPAKLVIPLGLCIFPVVLIVTLLPVVVRVKMNGL